ncbi:hypothetical protein CEXT_146241 [Caerostris extrusa]|uniref:Gustatory receptor n=1 Tax=Caerostris extrusa TaxID=172846 RepID=A0AAV4XM62_CAEEX|nr:hypothetical protein CEXT_146241 [Caerostris extrusa]
MESIENLLCLPMYFVALSLMVGLFRIGYALCFFGKSDLLFYAYCCSSLSYQFSLMVTMIMSASEANRVAARCRSLVASLQKPFEKDSSNFFWRQLNVTRKVQLTLWNTFIIERSLVWDALGTLFTYGILMGTLISVNEG